MERTLVINWVPAGKGVVTLVELIYNVSSLDLEDRLELGEQF